MGFAEILMRLNKSFVVHRDIKGVKETLRKLSKLSAYINHSLMKTKMRVFGLPKKKVGQMMAMTLQMKVF